MLHPLDPADRSHRMYAGMAVPWAHGHYGHIGPYTHNRSDARAAVCPVMTPWLKHTHSVGQKLTELLVS